MVDRPLEKEHQRIIYAIGITSRNVYFDETKGINVNFDTHAEIHKRNIRSEAELERHKESIRSALRG